MPLQSQSAVTNSLQAEQVTVAVGGKKKKKTFLGGNSGNLSGYLSSALTGSVSSMQATLDLASAILNLQASHTSSDFCHIQHLQTGTSVTSSSGVAVLMLAVELIPSDGL